MSFYSSDNSDSWNPQQGYTMPMGGKSSTSAVSVGVGSTSTGVSVPMRSVSRSMRSSRAVSLYAPAQHSSVANTQYPIGGTPSNSVASPLYTTSSATMKSFGGGTNGAVSMSSGVVSNNATSSPTNFVSMSSNLPSPLAYYPQSTTSFDGAQLTFAASSLQEIGASAVSYGASAPRGINGRRNAMGWGDGAEEWLNGIIGEGTGNGWMYESGGVNYFDESILYELYLAAVANGELPEGVSWEMFKQWFLRPNSGYSFPIPSGIWFMCILALGYGLYIAYRRKQKVVNS